MRMQEAAAALGKKREILLMDGKPSITLLSPRSFRAKFVIVVGLAVLFDLSLAGGVALFNVNRLSTSATETINEGLTDATREYLETYIETTAVRTNLLLDQTYSEVETLGGALQELIDNSDAERYIGEFVMNNTTFGDQDMTYNAEGNWVQNEDGKSVVSIWGYLLDDSGRLLPHTREQVAESSSFNLIAPSLMATGSAKLQMYYVGPKSAPIMRTTPYTTQAQTFDRLYPGHNEENFWDFFFPGVYEGWQGWLADPATKLVNREIVATEPYIDAITGALIVSFFQPLWTADRTDVAGMAAVDVTLDQFSRLVENVHIADTGFGFLTSSSGNILAVGEQGEKTLGLTSQDGVRQGVTGVNRYLSKSLQASVASLALPTTSDTVMKTVPINKDGSPEEYIFVLKRLDPVNMWTGVDIQSDSMVLGFVVSKKEIMQILTDVEQEISEATTRIILWQIAAIIVSLLIVFIAVFAISGRITAGLKLLAMAAQELRKKDYSVRVNIPTSDEVGEVGRAFNLMAEDMNRHTEDLERVVADRTADLARANVKITKLNGRLKTENRRMGFELNAAKRIQEMVLPTHEEVADFPQIDIGTYMEAADEVGGDYHDILQDGQRLKVGIGDVTGHGLESGALMLMVQASARTLQEAGNHSPRAFLDILNRTLCKNIERTKVKKHMSLAFADYHDDQLTLYGQHEDVLIIRSNGTTERIETFDLGFPVGLKPDIADTVNTRVLPFKKGDIAIFHTDGITEAENENEDFFGFERMSDCALASRSLSAEGIAKSIVEATKSHIGENKIHDDITIVVLKHR